MAVEPRLGRIVVLQAELKFMLLHCHRAGKQHKHEVGETKAIYFVIGKIPAVVRSFLFLRQD